MSSRSRIELILMADTPFVRRVEAAGVRMGRQMLRDGFTRLDVMRQSWREDLTGEKGRAFSIGLQRAAQHHWRMERQRAA